MEPIVWFSDLRRTSTQTAAARAPTWGSWRRDVPVPPGFVVTAAGVPGLHGGGRGPRRVAPWGGRAGLGGRRFIGPCNWNCRTSCGRRDCVPRSRADARRRVRGARAPGVEADPVVAVRSSATAEDAADTSFAGHEPDLHERAGGRRRRHGRRRAWASLFAERVLVYRTRPRIADRAGHRRRGPGDGPGRRVRRGLHRRSCRREPRDGS